MKLIEDWPSINLFYAGERFSVCNVIDDDGEINDPTGEYYIVEEDNNNGYGFHIGGAPTRNICPAFKLSEGVSNERGHSRIIAKVSVDGMTATVSKFNHVLANREGL